MPDFGTLRNVDLRQIWPHEASIFTPWLAENLEALGEAVGMELELTDTEANVGDFSLVSSRASAYDGGPKQDRAMRTE
jgi:hypothetical protein